ncbi:hypothetical protein GCM10025780_37470 [Frondihabitans cladoniiphilus]|uniref:Uncharacterized protein n=2 Tax=Frondihabitans cladoniiphilus TaxID=715785 RepID=A0ABP8WD84_9MICO
MDTDVTSDPAAADSPAATAATTPTAAAKAAATAPTPPTEPTWPELQSEMAAAVARVLGDEGWAEGTLFWAEVDSVASERLETVDATGVAREHDVPESIDALGRRLRDAMTDPDKGAWFSMTLTLASGGSFTSRFNYDRRVYDNPASPFAPGQLGDVPDDDAYARDLARHPRSPRYVPLWARPRAASTDVVVSGLYEPLRTAWGWPGVLAGVAQQTTAALAAAGHDGPLGASQVDALGQQVLSAVVADVLEPHRLATLLRLHAEAVALRLLPDVPDSETLDADETLVAARAHSTPALLAVEAGVYGVIGDLVRSNLTARLRG